MAKNVVRDIGRTTYSNHLHLSMLGTRCCCDVDLASQQRGDRLYASESDVYKRQILTHKDGSRAERVNPFPPYFEYLSYGSTTIIFY